MNKFKYYLSRFTTKVSYFLKNLRARSYGFDDLNKTLLIIAFALSIINMFIRSIVISLLSTLFMILFLFRFFSSKRYARNEENRIYRRYVKYAKTKWQFRKTHKIFLCKNCGQILRVPKGQGKIETTCPHCGAKKTRHS